VSSVLSGFGRRFREYGALLVSGDLNAIAWRLQVKMRRLDFNFVPVNELGVAGSRAKAYSDTGARLRAVLKKIPIEPSGFALDMGCGKGGAVLVLASRFTRADGVDISPGLVAIGRENLRRMGVTNASLNVCDAAEFMDLDGYNFIYLSNPFPRMVMQEVIANLMASLSRRPRAIQILYYSPVDGDLFEARGFSRHPECRLKPLDHPFVSYTWRPEAPSELCERRQ
jgi:SAM-dependent methyltransferase